MKTEKIIFVGDNSFYYKDLLNVLSFEKIECRNSDFALFKYEDIKNNLEYGLDDIYDEMKKDNIKYCFLDHWNKSNKRFDKKEVIIVDKDSEYYNALSELEKSNYYYYKSKKLTIFLYDDLEWGDNVLSELMHYMKKNNIEFIFLEIA